MTTLRNFDTELDTAGVTRITRTSTLSVTETITAHRPAEARTFLLGGESSWGWREVRDYVVSEIERRFGTFPREAAKEYGIFMAFCGRWGQRSGAIARYAFEVCDGMWRSEPITLSRFCLKGDPYFAQVISDRLPS